MPLMQTSLSSMNAAFSAENIASVDPKPFRPGARNSTLSNALRGVRGHGLMPAAFTYLDTWPTAIQAAVLAAIHNNLTRKATVPITFAWRPAYDYSVQIYDVLDTETSRGGMTILFESRYPADTHPLSKP